MVKWPLEREGGVLQVREEGVRVTIYQVWKEERESEERE